MKPPLRDHLARHMIVWIAQLSQAQDSLADLEPYLDARDRERAGRFRFPDDRGRFVLGRALVRSSLGHYLEQAPASIPLALTNLGRPFYSRDETIHFSLSHSQDFVAVALTAGARIGIDLEVIREHDDLAELAKRILSPADFAKFEALPGQEKLAAFYRAWTGKEAYLKARGEGIADGLHQISVSYGPETLSIQDSRTPDAGNWRLLTLPVPAAYAGALACDDPGRALDGAFVCFAHGEIVPDISGFTL